MAQEKKGRRRGESRGKFGFARTKERQFEEPVGTRFQRRGTRQEGGREVRDTGAGGGKLT